METSETPGAAHASAAPELSAASTRERVSRTVLARGPVTAAQLAADLGITPAAVRRHLDALAADGLVRQAPLLAGSAGRGPGRPARGWVATEAGHAAAPGAYDDLAAAALSALEREAGHEALERFARQRADELEARHRTRVEAAGAAPAARAGALAEALTADGYAARAAVLGSPRSTAAPTGQGQPGQGQPAVVPTSVQLVQGHCPVQAVAGRHPELCEAETAAFARLIGAPVRRLATLAAGHHACTTHVTTTAGQTAGPPHSPTPQTPQTSHANQGRSA